jgi:hypothetical protein
MSRGWAEAGRDAYEEVDAEAVEARRAIMVADAVGEGVEDCFWVPRLKLSFM